MSQTLHTSDYMSIFGEIKDGESPRLNLHFSIQVNGKLKTFTHFIELVEDKEASPSYSLKDYRVWYAICETLGELGYPIGSYDGDNPMGMNFISDWIEKCEEEVYNKDVFYR